MIVFDTPRPVSFRRFKVIAHCASTLHQGEGTEELLAFGRRIGLRASWLQHRGEHDEHFDLFDGAIARARAAGATEVSIRDFVRQVVRPKRLAGYCTCGRWPECVRR